MADVLDDRGRAAWRHADIPSAAWMGVAASLPASRRRAGPRRALPAGAAGPRHDRAPRVFPGWFVVAGAFLVVMVGYGATYSYAAYAEEIGAAFGSSRASVALVYALSGGGCFLVSGLSGPLVDRVGPRILAVTGVLLVALGLVVSSMAQDLVTVLVGYGLLIGLGVGFLYVPAVATVQRWFLRRRGLASGVAVSGIGFGTALVPPVSEALTRFGDWRAAFLLLAGIMVAVGLVGALLLDHSPERRGLRPDGDRHPAGLPPIGVAPCSRPVGWRPSPTQARGFAAAYAGALLVSLPVSLPFAHLVGTARDIGLSRHDALALLGLIGFGSIVGRFLLAALADVLGRRRTFLGCCAGVSAMTLLWAVAEGPGTLQAFALGFGAAQGGFVALLPAFVADSFGDRSVGSTLGLLYTSRGFALIAAAPGLAIGIAALDGAHAGPVAAAAALGGLGTVLLARVRPGLS
ncbi:MFS transporter [Muricoccus radiodurans]|uniref:MFS transporter n=1 Tax=Muricoccus radiodurans TaxID=2231721 RepID=UPI003CF6F5E6